MRVILFARPHTKRHIGGFCSILSVVSLIALNMGCASTHRSSRLAELPRGELPSEIGVDPAPIVSATTTSSFHPTLLTLNPRDTGKFRTALWTAEDSPHLQLAMTSTPTDSSQPSVATAPPKESIFSTDYWRLVGSDVKETFTAPAQWDKRDWLIAGGVTAGIGLTMVFDRDIQRAIQRNRNNKVNSIVNAVEPFGAEYSFGVLGAFYVGGQVFEDPQAMAVALDGLSASIIAAGLINAPLKYAVGRSRPGKDQGTHHFAPFSGNRSFASGHTTQAFAVATVIAEHYDPLWVKLGSYGVASMVGYARLNHNAHWASDVLAGAAIGTFVGHVVVHLNQKHRNVSLQPIVGPRMQGAEISFSF